MANFSKVNLNLGFTKKNRFNLNCQYLGSMDFSFMPVPTYKRLDVVPRDHFKVTTNTTIRTAPLAVPTYGSLFYKTASFFVPRNQLDEGFNYLIANRKYTADYRTLLNWLAPEHIFAAFKLCCFDVSASYKGSVLNYRRLGTLYRNASVQQLRECDIACARPDLGEGHYDCIELNAFGRQCLKILESLGYRNCVFTQESEFTSEDHQPFTTHALQAYTSICLNYFFNPTTADFTPLSQLIYHMQHKLSFQSPMLEVTETSTTVVNANLYYGRIISSSSGQSCYLTEHGLCFLFLNCFLAPAVYPKDYFTSAQETPLESVHLLLEGQDFSNRVGIGLDSPAQLNSQPSSYENNVNLGPNASTNNVTNFSLQAIDKLTKLLRRYNVSGTRVADRLKGLVGFDVESIKNDRPVLLGFDKHEFLVSDVMSTAQTESKVIGSYAGKAYLKATHSFTLDAKDYGLILTLSWIEPKTIYYQGIDRANCFMSPQDFYMPELDNLASQPIMLSEIYDNKHGLAGIIRADKVFGFTGNYNTMRKGDDVITGDFVHDYSLEAWHFGRSVVRTPLDPEVLSAIEVIPQAQSVSITNKVDAPDYDRIFTDETDGDYDHFYVDCRHYVDAQRPINKFDDTFEIGGEGSNELPLQGRQID
ncbi:major capsid protein [Capybara microvirus Cap1_SP_118]|nr:major capsid protein [Capybara microvirus Cap1_SP_118]